MPAKKNPGAAITAAALGAIMVKAMQQANVKRSVTYATNPKNRATAKRVASKFKGNAKGSRGAKTRTQSNGMIQSSESDLQQRNFTIGRRPGKGLREVRKQVQGNITRTVYGMRALSRYGGVNGEIWLPNSQAALGSKLFAPMVMFDLTGAPNDVRGSIVQPRTTWNVNFTTEAATANVVWDNAAVANQNLQVEVGAAAGTNVLNTPMSGSILRWVQARMLFYAPTSEATKISVQIVRFKDERLVPPHNAASTTGSAFASSFYQSLVRKFMINPIDVSNPVFDKYMTVLWSNTFIINPKESTDPSTTRHKILNVFYNFNRRCKYNWNDQDMQPFGAAAGAADNAAIDDVRQSRAEYETSVHPKARTFLIVRGMAGWNNTSASLDTTQQPSFDMVLRTCHEQLNP